MPKSRPGGRRFSYSWSDDAVQTALGGINGKRNPLIVEEAGVKTKLEYVRPIRIEGYASNSLVELATDCRVDYLLSFLKLRAHFHRAVIVHVNGEPAWNSTILKEK